ncbi:MAG: glycosyltransferase family 2 protein [Myxococcales bacterium]|nr:glycosyltransferase family 2 protein [Myxococcales bacterium]
MDDVAPEKPPLVAAVVLTWNDVEMASGCVQSLLECDYPNLHVILVDNGSIEPCGERVKERFPGIELIVLPQNRGFTGGSNAGLRRGVELGAKYVQLYNNDIVVEPGSVKAVVAEMESDPGLGACSPLLLGPDPGPDGDRHMFYGATLNRKLARHDNREVIYRDQAWPTVESAFVPFCATIFRASMLRDLGYLDESLGTCWEDFDMCVRVQDAGYRINVVGDARVVHFTSKTTGKRSPYIIYYLTRNRMICLARYNSKLSLLLHAPQIARTYLWQLRGYGRDLESYRAFARGARDFVLGRRGEDPATAQMRRDDRVSD